MFLPSFFSIVFLKKSKGITVSAKSMVRLSSINDKPVVDYPLEDIKNLVKDLIDSMDNKGTNHFILQKFLEEFIMEEGIYENLGKCEECGDFIDKYTYIYDSNKK